MLMSSSSSSPPAGVHRQARREVTGGGGFASWRPSARHGGIPATEDELAELYDFPSTEAMRSWLLMTDDEVLEGKTDLVSLMDERFVCDKEKLSVPKLGRETRAGDLSIRGTNLGGFLVLEPWITPSLFMQFLGRGRDDGVAMDMKAFCEVLGPEEGNKQLQRHWSTWVTQDIIEELARTGIDTLRLPVGDWQFVPYEPYIGCTDGANDQVARVLDLCHQNKIDVILDLHAIRGSPNGLDNSGESMNVNWHNNTHFEHWPTLNARWIGNFSADAGRYTSFDFGNFRHSLMSFFNMVQLFHGHPAVVAFQPVNEPWVHTPPNAYQLYVWTCYNMVQLADSNQGLIMHDSFRGSALIFQEWMVGCPNIVSDIHLYTAWDGWWMGDLNEQHFVDSACSQAAMLEEGQARIPHVVGEWSLATDNCAMWLNGFNDNPIGYPQVGCDWVPCPAPYMGAEQPGAPPDHSLGAQAPFGTGFSSPLYGKCPVDRSWEDDDVTMKRLARAKLAAFELTSGWFYWNFRTELEPKWSYLEGVRRGWLPDLSQEDASGQYMKDWVGDVCVDSWMKTGYLPTPVPMWKKVAPWVAAGTLGVVAIWFLIYMLWVCARGQRRVEYIQILDKGKLSNGNDNRNKRVLSVPHLMP
jgi:glucan 1,3-beta-glucosidase